MKAGMELDMLIKEHVMGGVWWNNGRRNMLLDAESISWAPRIDAALVRGKLNGADVFLDAYAYSTNMAYAWQVVDRLTEIDHGFFFALSNRPAPDDDQERSFVWCASFGGRMLVDNAPTPMFAICLAALKALNIEVPNA